MVPLRHKRQTWLVIRTSQEVWVCMLVPLLPSRLVMTSKSGENKSWGLFSCWQTGILNFSSILVYNSLDEDITNALFQTNICTTYTGGDNEEDTNPRTTLPHFSHEWTQVLSNIWILPPYGFYHAKGWLVKKILDLGFSQYNPRCVPSEVSPIFSGAHSQARCAFSWNRRVLLCRRHCLCFSPPPRPRMRSHPSQPVRFLCRSTNPLWRYVLRF